MFKGKVYFYQNVNGKEKKVEKEFNNPNEYYDYINSHNEFNPRNLLSGFNDFYNLDNYLYDFFNSRFALESGSNNQEENKNLLPEGINLEEYEKEAKKIDEEKENKAKEKNILEQSLEKLKEYLEKFTKEGKENLVNKVKEDIKKIEEKLKNLVK